MKFILSKNVKKRFLSSSTLKLLLLVISISLLFTSCASFKELGENPNLLTTENLKSLNGTYGASEIKSDTLSNVSNKYAHFYREMSRKVLATPMKLETNINYQFKIEVLDDNKVKILHLKDGQVFKQYVLRSKLKNDGYLYLRNKNVKFLFIPYAAGALDLNRMRLTKSPNGNLILDVASHRSGAFMFVLFLGGNSHSYRLNYPLEAI